MKSSQVDEAVWQAWLKKNRRQKRFKFERLVKVITLLTALITMGILIWSVSR